MKSWIGGIIVALADFTIIEGDPILRRVARP